MTANIEGHATEEQEAVDGVYVYGILHAPATLPDDLPTVGDGRSSVWMATHGDLAALVSELEVSRPLGTRDDLVAHERVLDSLAEQVTVLPMRFGAVVRDADAVVEELLRPHREHFDFVLSELAGTVQFTVRGRYVGEAHLREVVAEEPDVQELREALQGVPDDAGYAERMRLGELVNAAVTRKREADAEALADVLLPHSAASTAHEVGGQEDAVHMAFLVDRGHRDEFEQALDELGRRWVDRIQLRLLGPLAPYDFVPDR